MFIILYTYLHTPRLTLAIYTICIIIIATYIYIIMHVIYFKIGSPSCGTNGVSSLTGLCCTLVRSAEKFKQGQRSYTHNYVESLGLRLVN